MRGRWLAKFVSESVRGAAKDKKKKKSGPPFLSSSLRACQGGRGGGAFFRRIPIRAIRVIIPAAAGDSCDVLARLVGQKVSERLGQQLVIDNRPGAGGQLGLQLLTPRPRPTVIRSRAGRAATW